MDIALSPFGSIRTEMEKRSLRDEKREDREGREREIKSTPTHDVNPREMVSKLSTKRILVLRRTRRKKKEKCLTYKNGRLIVIVAIEAASTVS